MAKPKKKSTPASPGKSPARSASSSQAWKFVLPVCGITFLLFWPGIHNGFTNWDDPMYAMSNELLKSLDAAGLRAIWTTPVVSNYHPLTIMSLALNYQMAELDPLPYHLTNNILHAINTGLVFALVMMLSARNAWVSAFVALLFGIHPMHVESVAWVSERKDLLYTFFYLLAMMSYVRHVRQGGWMHLGITTVMGALSLLSKPAAIVLPLSLLALDYLLKRTWSARLIVEKLPLFVLAAVFTWLTLDIQSNRAMASLGLHSITDRICFAGFGFVWYILKAAIPWPLSALHPFPETLNAVYYAAPLVSAAIVGIIFLLVKNRNIRFGFAFFLINLLLVLQLVSIGNAVVAERYTYVPYIGLFFALGMEGYKFVQARSSGRLILGVVAAWIIVMMVLSYIRIPVWKDSQTLWADVLEHYPDSKRAWTNKGLDFFDRREWPQVIDHLGKALEADPNYPDPLEWRARTYLEMNEPEKALPDAEKFYRLYPNREASLAIYAQALGKTPQTDQALALFGELVTRYPNNWNHFNNRGSLLFNKFQRYADAKADFEKAIALNPQSGTTYLNLSRCYYRLDNAAKAREMANEATRLGTPPPPEYAKLIGL